MTELFNTGLTCCGYQRRHQRRVFTVIGSMSGSGLSMNVICGYCGEGASLSIPYPQFIQHLSPAEQETWRRD